MHGDPENLLQFGPARLRYPGIKFWIIRRDEPPVAADPGRLERAGWTGKSADWFEDTDEIAPGVKVKFLGYGDQFDANRNAVRGALIGVWWVQQNELEPHDHHHPGRPGVDGRDSGPQSAAPHKD